MFPGNRPASVTVDPEVLFTGPKKAVFPGSRAVSTSLDPERDGSTLARKGHFPTNYPAGGPTVDFRRDGSTSQANNASLGGQHGESGILGAIHQGADDPTHDAATATALPPFPGDRPATVTPDPAMNAPSGSALNTSDGGEHGESSV